jgi:hypothetical protein
MGFFPWFVGLSHNFPAISGATQKKSTKPESASSLEAMECMECQQDPVIGILCNM